MVFPFLYILQISTFHRGEVARFEGCAFRPYRPWNYPRWWDGEMGLGRKLARIDDGISWDFLGFRDTWLTVDWWIPWFGEILCWIEKGAECLKARQWRWVPSIPFNLSTKTIDLAKQPASLKAIQDMTITISIRGIANKSRCVRQIVKSYTVPNHHLKVLHLCFFKGQIGAAVLFAACGVMEMYVWKQALSNWRVQPLLATYNRSYNESTASGDIWRHLEAHNNQ